MTSATLRRSRNVVQARERLRGRITPLIGLTPPFALCPNESNSRAQLGEFAVGQSLDVFRVFAPAGLGAYWAWLVAVGAMLVVFGGLVAWRARAATEVFTRFLGMLAIAVACGVLVSAFFLVDVWNRFLIHVSWAVVMAIVGAILSTRPRVGAEALTLLIGFYFLVTGMAAIGLALSARLSGEWLYVAQGLSSLALGALLLAEWPTTGQLAIGLFIAIDLVIKGSAIVALGIGLRNS
jgi:uncharacterized membrane protein HdeD (DUF308 family)